jgi:7-keto-8-aminopelargonate synthetase-like enzyme
MITLPEPLRRTDATHVEGRGRERVFFGGCDYFRLSRHPALVRAMIATAENHGLNVAASRTTTGNHALYGRLEKALARFFGAESALLVSSGYVASLAVAQALAGEFTHVLIDERAHVCLADAAECFGAPVRRFAHRDANAVKRLADKLGPRSRLILLTDGLCAHDGGVAPLAKYLRALPRRSLLLVDDAHGAGVVGATGQGSLEHEGIGRERVIQCVTLSKAFGVYGGAVLGSRRLREQIIARSRLFIGNTPLPLPLAGAALKSVELLARGHSRRTRLRANAAWLKSQLAGRPLAITDTPGPIVAVRTGDEPQARRLSAALLRAGILPPRLRYPGSPAGGYFRFVISSEHTREQLVRLAEVLLRLATRPVAFTRQ